MQLTKNIKVLKKKDIKPLLKQLKEQWGFEEKLNYIFLSGKEDSIFIVNRDISNLELANLRINSVGLYIGKTKNGVMRLSIEGSQLIGPKATKNIMEISEKLARLWMKGYDIPYDEDKGKELGGFQIIKSGNDYMGCGIFKENRILNFLPKARTLHVDD